jgi:hypothetical protein
VVPYAIVTDFVATEIIHDNAEKIVDFIGHLLKTGGKER